MLLIPAFLCWILLYRVLRNAEPDRRAAFVHASVYWGLILFVITELLSVWHWITAPGLAIAWTVACGGCLVVGRLARRTHPPQPKAALHFGLSKGDWLLLAGSACIFAIITITAVVSAPCEWDAMEYHLPRVSMWMSSKSIAFYPTPDYLQLVFAPWSEYAMMHVHLLWGSDRLVNLVEFFSFAGSAIAASWSARLLGCGVRGQVIAAAVCAAIPEGALEASGPMNTAVVSFWIVAAVGCLLAWGEEPNWLNFTSFGIASGLALLTKGIAYVYLPPLCLALFWILVPRLRVRFLKWIPLAVALVLAINTPHFLRCYSLSGSPLGMPLPDGGARMNVRVAHPTIGSMAANIVRNISLDVTLPGDRLTSIAEIAARKMISAMGQNPDDPSSIWTGSTFHMNHFTTNEIHAGNPLHLVLLAAACLWAMARGFGAERRQPFFFAAGLVGAFVLFSALLRWQIWNSRYFLPLFVVGAALTAVFMETALPRKLSFVITAVLLASTSVFALTNRTRSLVRWGRVVDVYHPRAELYFSDEHEAIARDTIALADRINQGQCREIAIDSYFPSVNWKGGATPPSLFVYPLFALIHVDGRHMRIHYAGVHNLSARYEGAPLKSCAVVCLDCARVPRKLADYARPAAQISTYGDNVLFQYGEENAPDPR